MRLPFALARAGFRRYATYRQATVAASATNSVFGCMRAYVLLAAVASAGGTAGGYTGEQLSTYVWVGQGLLGVVLLWGWNDLADRVRTGDVTMDLLRPVNPLWTYLATDIGRAGFAMCTRMVVPMAVGVILFPFYWPEMPATYPLFVVSIGLAVLVCFALRYLVNLSAFWLLDSRGVSMLWVVASGVGSGLYFPLEFLPDGMTTVLYYGTPFPSIMQFPADVAVEYDGLAGQLNRIGIQAFWCLVCLSVAAWAQHRATRRLVIQGG
jgi:ABC-2 type transport system permease protein